MYKVCGEDIKEIQKIQLEVAKELDRICRKHNITYHLYSGTLLGAIRHNGFIPWDDDLDVCMLRHDYERFLMIAQDELGDDYFMQTIDTDPKYLLQFGKIRKENTTFVENSYKHDDIHHGVYIDVFPFDNVELDTKRGKKQINKYYILNRLTLIRSKAIVEMASGPSKMVRNIVHTLIKLFPKHIMDKMQYNTALKLQDEKTHYVTDLVSGDKYTSSHYLVERNKFLDVIEWEFEGHKFLIPRNYDEILTRNFGDYMSYPPLEDQRPHHNIIKLDLTKKDY